MSSKGSGSTIYRVRKGDSLWSIARTHEVAVNELKKEYDLKRSTIQPGETLKIPMAP